MKVSLRWLCSHINDLPWHLVDVAELVVRFNAKVAEIEHVEQLRVSLDALQAARVTAVQPSGLSVTLADGKSFSLPYRNDVSGFALTDLAVLLTFDAQGKECFATLRDVGLDKDGLVPPLAIKTNDLSGGWKSVWEAQDVILDVDNKSLTHRPDMWGHRGFAREVAALFGKHLLDAKSVCEAIATTEADSALTVINKAPAACSAIAGLRVANAQFRPSDVQAASRLINIGYRPRNAMVDMTNYAMADWGHPMHAYDADQLAGNTLCVRFAQDKEKIELLDGASLNLTSQDLVITDAQKPVALAGIMGGKNDSVQQVTQTLVLEAACFHAATVRRSSARHKIRTESSQRFEKTLDPEQVIHTLERCIFLARQWGVISAPLHHPIVLMKAVPYNPLILAVSHNYLIGSIGAPLGAEEIVSILKSIDFEVSYTEQGGDIIYTVKVPSYRATKDISGAHDIMEEVARLYGFNAITPRLPAVVQRASSTQHKMRESVTKRYFAYSAGMREQRNYAFYYEPFLTLIDWREEEKASLRNPVSQEERRLVSTLIPRLLANVVENMADADRLAFFEWGTVWLDGQGSERKELAAVWYDKRGKGNFYSFKQTVIGFAQMFGVALEWHNARDMQRPQWLASSQAVCLTAGGSTVGWFGMIDPVMIQKMGGLPESNGYAFTFDASWLLHFEAHSKTAVTVNRFQHSSFDVSILIPQRVEVAALEKMIAGCSGLIEEVRLIDFFEKKEWTESRSVAFRVLLSRVERTLTREEIEEVRTSVFAELTKVGAQLRS